MNSPTRKEVDALIREAIGYDPIRVSLSPGVGGLTYRTVEDADGLVERIGAAVYGLLIQQDVGLHAEADAARLIAQQEGEVND